MSQSDQGYSSGIPFDPTGLGVSLGQSLSQPIAQGASAVSSLVTFGQILLGVAVAGALVLAYKAVTHPDAGKHAAAAARYAAPYLIGKTGGVVPTYTSGNAR